MKWIQWKILQDTYTKLVETFLLPVTCLIIYTTLKHFFFHLVELHLRILRLLWYEAVIDQMLSAQFAGFATDGAATSSTMM